MFLAPAICGKVIVGYGSKYSIPWNIQRLATTQSLTPRVKDEENPISSYHEWIKTYGGKSYDRSEIIKEYLSLIHI